ncbi:hypothetical protein ACQ4PT_000993 [Festuca glaucescens]
MSKQKKEEDASESEDHFVGDPIPDDEARRLWPERYKSKDSDDRKVITKRSDAAEKEKSARCHYRSAIVEGAKFDLGDDVYVWVITSKLKVPDHEHDHKRVFLSEEKDDSLIESIISKVNITYVGPNDFHWHEINVIDTIADLVVSPDAQMERATLLDLYSGCGAMSTGLCMGAPLSGLKLTTKWAVDMNKYACDSLKHNHPRTQAENFLKLLQEWDRLCKEYDVHNSTSLPRISNDDEDDENGVDESLSEGTFEVEKLVDICYGDPNKTKVDGLWFKVRWKTYDSSHDTWEPLDGLRDSPECIKEFVESGYRESILPLPVLPKFPLPTHDAINRGQHEPTEFSQCLVACDETESKDLENAPFLRDGIHDLPKGANFRNLKGVRVGKNKSVEFDPNIPREFLLSGKPLVPNYAMTYAKGKSSKPFRRLWWDETVSTVVTRAEPHNQAILHPNQDRVLTVRENARLQGFPDYYRLSGPIKQKYIQVGNAVAVPVARALGCSLGQAYQQGEFSGDQHPLFKLPANFIPVAQARAA